MFSGRREWHRLQLDLFLASDQAREEGELLEWPLDPLTALGLLWPVVLPWRRREEG